MMTPSTTFPTIAGKKTQLTIGGEGPPLLYLHSAGGETEWIFGQEPPKLRIVVSGPVEVLNRTGNVGGQLM